MPHKRNPVAAASVLAAASRVPVLMASLYQGMVQEHERSWADGRQSGCRYLKFFNCAQGRWNVP